MADVGTAFSNVITQSDAQAVVNAAFEAWSRVAALQFVYAPQDNAGVDIRLGWGAFAASTDTTELGETDYNYLTTDNDILPDVRIRLLDPARTPLSDGTGTPTYTSYDVTLYQVTLREIGRAIGLAHDVTDANAIMYPYASPQNRQLAAADNARGTFILGNGSSSSSGAFTYAGQQEAASVIGGGGIETITGGTGGGFYSGGSTGNNLLTAQGIGSVLVGGGNNDVLRAAPIGHDYLVAGAGGSTDRFYLGSGRDQAQFGTGPGLLVTGTGSATIFAGNGNSAVFGGSGGADLAIPRAAGC